MCMDKNGHKFCVFRLFLAKQTLLQNAKHIPFLWPNIYTYEMTLCVVRRAWSNNDDKSERDDEVNKVKKHTTKQYNVYEAFPFNVDPVRPTRCWRSHLYINRKAMNRVEMKRKKNGNTTKNCIASLNSTYETEMHTDFFQLKRTHTHTFGEMK